MRAILALMLLPLSLAAQELPVEHHRLKPPAGLVELLRPEHPAVPPLVIILPEALGADGRAELYRDSLLARGIATLLLGLGEDQDAVMTAIDPAASPEAASVALDWARARNFAPLGLMGFGLGGRAALAASRGEPVLALYARCPELPPTLGPALLVQGEHDDFGCYGLPSHIALHLLPDAWHAWDAPGAAWPSAGPVLPDPAGGPRLRARTDPEATRAAAEVTAAWFVEQFGQPAPALVRTSTR